jgi:hypothetical protein
VTHLLTHAMRHPAKQLQCPPHPDDRLLCG